MPEAAMLPCPETNLGTSSTLRQRLLRKALAACVPINASIEVTQRCNLSCVHCYNFDRTRANSQPPESELTPSEILDIIDQLKDAGCLYLAFTGGEALVHPHIEDFIRHAKQRRLAVRLKTNGAMLTPARVAMLADAGVIGVEISLYGASAATHDAITSVGGSFANTLAGIGRARDAGLAVKVNLALFQGNAAEVAQMLQLMHEQDLSYSINPFITARYDGSDSPMRLALDQGTLEALYRGPLKSFRRPPRPATDQSIQCGCARVNCGITATGLVYPCIGAPVPSGNLRCQRFAEIWQHSPQFKRIRALTLEDFESCRRCPDRPYCGRNSGVAYSNTGHYTGPEPFTCMDASITRRLHLESQGLSTLAPIPPISAQHTEEQTDERKDNLQ